jgi:hypothetical protein
MHPQFDKQPGFPMVYPNYSSELILSAWVVASIIVKSTNTKLTGTGETDLTHEILLRIAKSGNLLHELPGNAFVKLEKMVT